MLWIDTKHRGTKAAAVIEWNDEAIPVFVFQTVHQMDLGPHGPIRTCGRFANALNNVFGRSYFVGKLRHFKAAFRMGYYPDVRVTRSYLLNVLR